MHHVNRFGLRARQCALFAWILGFAFGEIPFIKIFFFRVLWAAWPVEGEHVSVHHELEFINKWGERWVNTGNLEDMHGGGMPAIVPPRLALEAVTLVKSGFET